MTTEEKFKQILQIAVNNGYQTDSTLRQWLGIDDKTAYGCERLNIPKIVQKQGAFMEFSLRIGHWFQPINDLILETNFFDCLFKGWSLYTEDYSDTLIKLRADYIDANGVFSIGEDSLELSCHKNTVVQFKKIQWVLEVEKGTALEWLFKQFGL